MAESAEGARLLSEYVGKLASRVRIPVSPPVLYKRAGFHIVETGSFFVFLNFYSILFCNRQKKHKNNYLHIRFAQVDAATYDIMAVITRREERTTK